jgi:hypothetical protein
LTILINNYIRADREELNKGDLKTMDNSVSQGSTIAFMAVLIAACPLWSLAASPVSYPATEDPDATSLHAGHAGLEIQSDYYSDSTIKSENSGLSKRNAKMVKKLSEKVEEYKEEYKNDPELREELKKLMGKMDETIRELRTDLDHKNDLKKITPKTTYEDVATPHIDAVAGRLKLVETILRKTGKAYDYRAHTTKQLEAILAQNTISTISPTNSDN